MSRHTNPDALDVPDLGTDPKATSTRRGTYITAAILAVLLLGGGTWVYTQSSAPTSVALKSGTPTEAPAQAEATMSFVDRAKGATSWEAYTRANAAQGAAGESRMKSYTDALKTRLEPRLDQVEKDAKTANESAAANKTATDKLTTEQGKLQGQMNAIPQPLTPEQVRQIWHEELKKEGIPVSENVVNQIVARVKAEFAGTAAAQGAPQGQPASATIQAAVPKVCPKDWEACDGAYKLQLVQTMCPASFSEGKTPQDVDQVYGKLDRKQFMLTVGQCNQAPPPRVRQAAAKRPVVEEDDDEMDVADDNTQPTQAGNRGGRRGQAEKAWHPDVAPRRVITDRAPPAKKVRCVVDGQFGWCAPSRGGRLQN